MENLLERVMDPEQVQAGQVQAGQSSRQSYIYGCFEQREQEESVAPVVGINHTNEVDILSVSEQEAGDGKQ